MNLRIPENFSKWSIKTQKNYSHMFQPASDIFLRMCSSNPGSVKWKGIIDSLISIWEEEDWKPELLRKLKFEDYD
jgi:hypothetical protein